MGEGGGGGGEEEEERETEEEEHVEREEEQEGTYLENLGTGGPMSAGCWDGVRFGLERRWVDQE